MFFAASVATAASPVNPLEQGFAGALRGCEEWVLNPASWTDGPAPFLRAVGLGDQVALVSKVDEASLPPKQLRAGNRYWRINSTATAGYVLVVSDQLPMCHITGGGDADLQPVAETVLASQSFRGAWRQTQDTSNGEVRSTVFQNRADPALSLIVSRAKETGARRDGVQITATAVYALR